MEGRSAIPTFSGLILTVLTRVMKLSASVVVCFVSFRSCFFIFNASVFSLVFFFFACAVALYLLCAGQVVNLTICPSTHVSMLCGNKALFDGAIFYLVAFAFTGNRT